MNNQNEISGKEIRLGDTTLVTRGETRGEEGLELAGICACVTSLHVDFGLFTSAEDRMAPKGAAKG